MTAREMVARDWHQGSDHAADGEPFGGPVCDCWRVAGRMLPMLAAAWENGWETAIDQAPGDTWFDEWHYQTSPYPYESEEDRHVDQ